MLNFHWVGYISLANYSTKIKTIQLWVPGIVSNHTVNNRAHADKALFFQQLTLCFYK